MTDVSTQIILFSAGAALCFAGTFFFMATYLLGKEQFKILALASTSLSAFPLTTAFVLRWVQTGHFPYLGLYETLTTCAAMLVLCYLILQFFWPSLRAIGLVVLPIAVIMIGFGVSGSTEAQSTPESYYTFWLWVHILSASLAYISVIIAGALAALYLLKLKKDPPVKLRDILTKMPPLENLDFLNYRFSAIAFILQGIMIASGAIWAFNAWGRYWGWDPIETWSLISWIIYGAYLHLRIMGIKGKAASWLGVVAIVLVIFSLFGAPVIYPTIHETMKIVK